MLVATLALAFVLAVNAKGRAMKQPTVIKRDDVATLAIIRAAADRHQVPRDVALAFAWCESGLNPRAQGDVDWHLKRGGEKYNTLVLQSAKFKFNPARTEASAWHSYGLYQLLAVYHVQPHEHPRVLLDPALNADRGCAEIARLLKRANGDVRAARLAYVGCGYGGTLCSEAVVSQTVSKLTAALQRYAHERQATT